MGRLSQIIWKNFKELIKNKLSLFILVLGPIIIIILLGFFYYSANSHSLNLGVYGDSNSKLLPHYIQGFEESGFKVIRFNSENECVDSIKTGLIPACVIFPEDFRLADNKTNLIKVQIDESKGKITNLIEHSIYVSFDIQNQKLQLMQTQLLINSISETENKIETWRTNLSTSKELLSQIQKNNEKIKINIDELNSIYNSKDFDIETITSGVSKVNSSINNVLNSTSILIVDLKDNVGNISYLLDSGNVSGSDVDEIESLILDTKSLISSLSNKLTSFGGDKYETGKLVKEISSLDKDLTDLDLTLKTKSSSINLNVENTTKEQKELLTILNTIDLDALNLLNDIQKIEIKDSQSLVKPVTLDISNVSSKANNNLSAIFPSLIASLIMIISLFLASTFILQEKKSEASFRNYIAQVSGFLSILGNFLSLLIIVFFQMTLIILIYYLVFLKVPFIKTLLVILIILPIISLFILIGMIIGNISKSETVNSIFLFVLIFCFLTFSGLLLPIESLSYLMQSISLLNPYIISEGILRKIIIFEMGFNSVSYQVIILSVLAVLFFIFNLVLDSFIKKGELYHYYIYLKLKFKEKMVQLFVYFKSKFKRKESKNI